MGQLRGRILKAKVGEFRVVAVVDPWEPNGRALAEEVGGMWCSDLQTVFASPDIAIDAVWISTGTRLHHDLILQSLVNHKPTFCEKPISDSAEEIINCFNLSTPSAPLCCGFQRRFDPHYAALLDAVKVKDAVGTVQTIHVVFRDHPCPPIEFLKEGGDPFNDLAPHDVDFVNLLLGEEPVEVYAQGSAFHLELVEAGVMDPAVMMLKYPSGALVTLEMSRNAEYGYDQRIEVFGTKGSATVRSPPTTSLEVANQDGFHTAVLDFSFPQRFHVAFAAEIDAFAQVVRGQRPPWVGLKECLSIHSICAAALQSATTGSMQCLLPVTTSTSGSGKDENEGEYDQNEGSTEGGGVTGRTIALRFIGCGVFGSFIMSLLRKFPKRHNFKLLPPYTRASGLCWDGDVINDIKNLTEAVYICTPDDMHAEQTITCLENNLHVLVEKPILEWKNVHQYLQTTIPLQPAPTSTSTISPSLPWLQVGFQRRYDREYQSAREYCRRHLVHTVELTAQDPWDAEQDTNDPEQLCAVLRNSLCHEFDLLGFLFPSAQSVELSAVEPRPRSGAFVAGILTVPVPVSADAATNADGGLIAVAVADKVHFNINFSKGHSKHYGQVVSLDGVVFGYPKFKVSGFQEAGLLYEQAYVDQFADFYQSCAHPQRRPQTRRDVIERNHRTFSIMERACDIARASHGR